MVARPRFRRAALAKTSTEAATLSTSDGKKIVIVAVGPAVRDDEDPRRGLVYALSSMFPDADRVVLATSTSEGVVLMSDASDPPAEMDRERVPWLNWNRYTLSPA